MNNPDKSFKIGLCLAGAISAGAYTAGVMDYLIEALDEWQKRKDEGIPNTPSHKVKIPVIGGASAGGMTGVMTAAALVDPITPVRKVNQSDLSGFNPDNKFYRSWVGLTSDNMLSELLNISDLENGKLESALNAGFIDKIADEVVKVSAESPIQRPYIADRLKVFVTLSNLEGMKYSTNFNTINKDPDKFIIHSHSDYACFVMSEKQEDYEKNGWIPLNFKKNLNVTTAKNAAMATGAFPIGLKARNLMRESRFMNDHPWFSVFSMDTHNPFINQEYNTVNVDGGMINNEPFENVRSILNEITESKPEEIQHPDHFQSTVLMIDPFPSEIDDFKNDTKLGTIIPNILDALMNQSKAKPSILGEAVAVNKAGQYLIAPIRYAKKEGKEIAIEGKLAIACGSIGGFGGFISKEFRIHDYFLGRANCEQFLREHFTVPADTLNPIFAEGYSEVDKSMFLSSSGRLQIIPIFSIKQDKAYMPIFSNGKNWPEIERQVINSYKRQIKRRTEKIISTIARVNLIQKVLLWIGLKVLITARIADGVINYINKALAKHELLK